MAEIRYFTKADGLGIGLVAQRDGDFLGETADQGGIDGIGFGVQPFGVGQVTDASLGGDGHFDPGLVHGFDQQPFVASGGLASDARMG